MTRRDPLDMTEAVAAQEKKKNELSFHASTTKSCVKLWYQYHPSA